MVDIVIVCKVPVRQLHRVFVKVNDTAPADECPLQAFQPSRTAGLLLLLCSFQGAIHILFRLSRFVQSVLKPIIARTAGNLHRADPDGSAAEKDSAGARRNKVPLSAGTQKGAPLPELLFYMPSVTQFCLPDYFSGIANCSGVAPVIASSASRLIGTVSK